MLRAFTNAPMAVGAVIWSPLRTTLVAKAAFTLREDGTFDVERALAPLALDTFDPQGEVVYPTDFAPYKPACDVVVGGRDALERRTAGSLVVGTLARSVEPTESLGPRESFCPSGDPSDPEVQAAWMDGRMEFSRFQCAGPRQRLPWPEGALRIELVRGPLVQRAWWLGPWPSLILEDPGGARRPIAMPLDTIVLFPSERRLIGVWRAILDIAVPGEHRAYLHLPRLGREDVSTWTETAVGLPGALRARHSSGAVAVADAQGDGTVVRSGHAPMAWPFAAGMSATRDDAPLPEADRTQAVTLRTPARTLPFRREEGAASQPRRPHIDLSALRVEGGALVRPVWDPHEATASIASISRPHPVALAVAPPVVALSAVQAHIDRPAPAVPVAPPMSRWPLPAGPADGGGPGLRPAESEHEGSMVEAIQREIWKGERPLAAILIEHGIAESEWRTLRKRAGESR